MRQDVALAATGYNARSDRIIPIRLLGKSINITILQVCTPTTAAEEVKLKA